jgi:hypothetical protein
MRKKRGIFELALPSEGNSRPRVENVAGEAIDQLPHVRVIARAGIVNDGRTLADVVKAVVEALAPSSASDIAARFDRSRACAVLGISLASTPDGHYRATPNCGRTPALGSIPRTCSMTGDDLLAILGRCADFCMRIYGWSPARIASEYQNGRP